MNFVMWPYFVLFCFASFCFFCYGGVENLDGLRKLLSEEEGWNPGIWVPEYHTSRKRYSFSGCFLSLISEINDTVTLRCTVGSSLTFTFTLSPSNSFISQVQVTLPYIYLLPTYHTYLPQLDANPPAIHATGAYYPTLSLVLSWLRWYQSSSVPPITTILGQKRKT